MNITTSDVEVFRDKAQNYLRRRGIDDEDLLSEMVLYFWERNGQPISLKNAYLRGCDRLYPAYQNQGVKQRRHIGHMEFDETWFTPVEDDDLTKRMLEVIPSRGSHRAMMILLYVYGYSSAEVSQLFGVTPSRISQQLGAGRSEHLTRKSVSENINFSHLEWGIEWLRL